MISAAVGLSLHGSIIRLDFRPTSRNSNIQPFLNRFRFWTCLRKSSKTLLRLWMQWGAIVKSVQSTAVDSLDLRHLTASTITTAKTAALSSRRGTNTDLIGPTRGLASNILISQLPSSLLHQLYTTAPYPTFDTSENACNNSIVLRRLEAFIAGVVHPLVLQPWSNIVPTSSKLWNPWTNQNNFLPAH